MNPKLDLFKEQMSPALPPIYYHMLDRTYLVQQRFGVGERKWIAVGEKMACNILAMHGVSKQKEKRDEMSDAERVLTTLALDPSRSIGYMGPIGGCYSGIVEFGSFRALVTESPKPPMPVEGDCGWVLDVVNTLFGKARGGAQLAYILTWLRQSYEMLLSGDRRGMPALILIGEHDCGKSFFQEHVVTPLLGGRVADAKNYLVYGSSRFNSDLFRCEHLCVQDPTLSTAMADRQGFGERLKELVANENRCVEAKFKEGVNMNPYSRITLSLNNKFETMLGLFPVTSDIADKFCLFRCTPVKWPVFARTAPEKKEFVGAFEKQIPAFCWWLLNRFEVPYGLTIDGNGAPTRFGMRCYHDPDVLRSMAEVTPEFRLLELIRQCFCLLPDPKACKAPGDLDTIQMSALDLERGLKSDDSPVRMEARSLLHSSRAVSLYLGRLHERFPDQIFQPVRGPDSPSRVWVIRGIDDMLDTSSSVYDTITEQRSETPNV